MLNQVLSVQRKFEEAELLLVHPSEVNYVIKLARDCIDDHIARAHAANASKEKRRPALSVWKTLTSPNFMKLKAARIDFASPA